MGVAALLLIVVVGTIAIAARQAEGKAPVPGIEPQPGPDVEPGNPEIPWSEDAWTWEIYVQDDGTVVDEAGVELDLEGGLVPIEVCPGDTIVLRVPEVDRRTHALPFIKPPVPWLELVVSSWETGDFAWRVLDGDDDERVELGAFVRAHADAVSRRFGFAVSLGRC